MKKTLRIPGIIDSTGRWAAWGYGSQQDIDWGQIDEMADGENPLINGRRFWVTVEVELPMTVDLSGTSPVDHICRAYHDVTGRDQRALRADILKVLRDEDSFKDQDPERGSGSGFTDLGKRN